MVLAFGIETSQFDTDQRKRGQAFQPGMAW
jgi:hypothetical protein